MQRDCLDDDIGKFNEIKDKIPFQIKYKLQYMLDQIKKVNNYDKISAEQQAIIQDLRQIPVQALKVIFQSIITSLYSKNSYINCEKHCRIKILSNRWMSKDKYKWHKVSIDYGDQFIYFNKVNKTFKFPINGMGINKTEHEEKQIIQILYDNKIKAKLKFDSHDQSEFFKSKLKQGVQRTTNKLQRPITQSKIFQNYSVLSYEQDSSYKKMSKNKNVSYFCHKRQPKVFCELIIRMNEYNLPSFFTLLILQKFWNNKVKSQSIKHGNDLLDPSQIIIQRKYKSVSSFGNDRKTITKAKISYLSQISEQKLKKYRLINNNPKYIIQEEDISDLMIDEKRPSKFSVSSIKSCLNLTIIVELLTEKVCKVLFYIDFKGNGNYSQSDSKNALNFMFSDVLFLPQSLLKIKKDAYQKQKNWIQLTKIIQQRLKTINYNAPQYLEAKSQIKYSDSYIQNQNKEITQLKKKPKSVKSQMQEDSKIFIEEVNNQSPNSDQFYDIESNSDFSNNSISINDIDRQNNEQIRSNHCLMSQTYEIMQKCRPKNPFQQISPQYIELIRQKIYEKSYLLSKFTQEIQQTFDSQTPWYFPSIMIDSGKQYKVNQKNQLVFINTELLDRQKDSLIFVIKQLGANILKGKSIMNVSLPVDIFQSKSLLERSAASFGCAPRYLKGMGDADILAQMKKVVCFIFSVPSMQLIMEKPFNPILGQTFQAKLGGIPIYYQQISHHPPISSYYMECNDFKLFGNLIAQAQVGLNSGYGRNAGVMNIVMRNGSHFIVIFPSAEISGLIYGDRKYKVCDKAYVIQQNNCLMGQISFGKQSKGIYDHKSSSKLTSAHVIGGIFRTTKKFMQRLNPFAMKSFCGITQQDISKKQAQIEGIWYRDLFIDGQNVTEGNFAYPVQYPKHVLPSNSNYRLDIMLHRLGDIKKSQYQKQILQNAQRNDRKLRQKHKKK